MILQDATSAALSRSSGRAGHAVWTAALAALMLTPGCRSSEPAALTGAEAAAGLVPVSIRTGNGVRGFKVEVARTPAEQQRGLMFRTDIPADGGMLFAPYPPEGEPAREASFWMENTPTPLDIIFIRADGTIARIAENTVPFSRDPVTSGEPVSAVLEILGGKSAELGIAAGDQVTLPPARR